MPHGIDSAFDVSADLGFFVLFPGFVAYRYAVATGWIPPVLGGLFGPASIIFAALALAHLLTHSQSRTSSAARHLEAAFVLYTLCLLLWTLSAWFFIVEEVHAWPAVKESLATLLIWFAVYFIGARMRIGRNLTHKGLTFAALLLVGLFLHSMAQHQSLLGPFLIFQGQEEGALDEAATTYQGVGRSIMILAMVVAALRQKFREQILVLLAAIAGLLCLGSRSHLFAMILVVAIVGLLLGLKERNRKTAVVLLVPLLATAYVATTFFLETRAGEIIDLSESTSWQARLVAQRKALEVISESPFFGEFGYHHRADVYEGYAHNILSAWAGFGGAAFLIFLGLILYALYESGRRVLLAKRCSSLWLISFQLNLAALILSVASEPIFSSVFPALGWGFTVNAMLDERRRLSAPHETRHS